MKAYIALFIGLLLVADFALANRVRNRTRVNEGKIEKTEKKEQERARMGFQSAQTARSKGEREIQIEGRIEQAANNSKGTLTAVSGLVELAKVNPSQKLHELVDYLVTRKVELESATRSIDNAKKQAIDASLEAINKLANKIETNSNYLTNNKKTDAADMLKFLNNYVKPALGKESNWNSSAVNNLVEFLVAIRSGVDANLSLQQIVENHGRFTYKEFRNRCRKA